MANPARFEDFFDAQYTDMVRALTLVFSDRGIAEDAAQVGFEKALSKWRRVSVMERPGTWVYVVALRHGRRQLRREVDEAEPSSFPVADSSVAVVDSIWMADLLRRLPPRQRAAVVLRHLGGLHLTEIAEAMNISVGTVKSTLHSAYRNLRVEITDEQLPEVTRDAR